MAATDNRFNYRDGVSLREYIEECIRQQGLYFEEKFKQHIIFDNERFKIVEKHNEDNLTKIDRSITIAYSSMEKRLEGMNEFRSSLRDQAAGFVTKESYDAKHDTLLKQVDELRISRATLEGKASQSSMNIAFIMSAIGVTLSILGFLTNFIWK